MRCEGRYGSTCLRGSRGQKVITNINTKGGDSGHREREMEGKKVKFPESVNDGSDKNAL